MASLYISEFKVWGLIPEHGGARAQIAREPHLAKQKVTFTTAAASAAFNADTRYIRLIADADFHAAFGASPTATAAFPLHKANTEYFYAVTAGHKISAYDGTS